MTLPRHRSRATRPVVLGSLAAAAVLVLAGCGDETDPAGGPTSAPTQATDTAEPTEEPGEPSQSPSTDPGTEPTAERAPVYYLGDGPSGTVLFVEEAPIATDDETGALQALAAKPTDPDYRTLWTEGQLVSASVEGDVTNVEIASGATSAPAGASAGDARLSVQQVAWTMTQLTGTKTVQFTVDGEPASEVLGVPTPGPVKASGPLKNLSQMMIVRPREGEKVDGRLEAHGLNNGFEAWAGWQLLQDGEVVREGFTTAEGWGDRLYPWEAKIEMSLPPGTYVLRFHNDDPSGGAEGNGPAEDTRTIVVG